MPVYFAFQFGAYCMFHEHEKFDTMTKVIVTLNAILAGDEILDFILALMTYGKIGILYAFAFCILFIICIHNVFIYVIGEAFKEHSSKYEKEKRKIAKQNTQVSKEKPQKEQDFNAGIIEDSSVVSKDVYLKEQVLYGEDEINFVKKKIFNKIIPMSRDKHIIDMNSKKDMIKEDIHYMKESIQNLVVEDIGRSEIT